MYSWTRMPTLSPECDSHYIELCNRDLFLLTQVCQYGLLIKQSVWLFYSACLPHILSKQTYWLGFQGGTKNKYKLGVMAGDESLKVNFRCVLCWTSDAAWFCESALMTWPAVVPYFSVRLHVCTSMCTCKDNCSFLRVFSQRRVRNSPEAQTKVL